MTEGVGSPVNTQDKVVLASGTSNTAGGSSELTVGASTCMSHACVREGTCLAVSVTYSGL